MSTVWKLILVIAGVAIASLAYAVSRRKGTNVPPDAETDPEPPRTDDISCSGTSYLGWQDMPLGFRNNNPLNLVVCGYAWKGKLEPKGRFERFCSLEYGTRAALRNLRTYINRYQRNTIHKIISAWAPATENDTKAYIQAVSQWTGLPANQQLAFEKETMFTLFDAMTRMENGTGYLVDDTIKESAWNMLDD